MTALLPILFTACATSPNDSSTTRRWIIGFGWVDSVHDRAVDAQSLAAVGIVADSKGIQAGIITSHRTAIDPWRAGDAIVEVESTTFDLNVRTRDLSPRYHNP